MRITAAASSSNVTAPAQSQAVSPGGSFQTIFAHASTGKDAEPQATPNAAPPSVRSRDEDHADDGVNTASAGSTETQSSAVDDLGVDHAQSVSAAIAADTSAATGTASTCAPAGTTVPAVAQASSDVNFRQAIVSSFPADAGSASSLIHAVVVPATEIATSTVSPKQDRAKGQGELKKAALAVAVLTVIDPGTLPSVSVISLPGTAHGQESGLPGNPVKFAVPENFAGTHGKIEAGIDGPRSEDTGAAPLPGLAAGVQQSDLMQTPQQSFEAGLNLSMASGLTANAEQSNNAMIALPAGNPAGAGSATAVFPSFKAIDGASNSKSASSGVDNFLQAGSDSKAGQSVQADLPKTDAGIVISRAAENGAAQTTLQTVLIPTGVHDGAAAQGAITVAPASVHAGKSQDLPVAAHPEATAASGINSARLIQTMGETEMHVGMHSAEFGDISIRTSLSQQQMVTHIALDHNDLSQAILSHLSAVQAKLGEEYGLHASIEVNSQGAALSNGQENSQQRDQQTPARSSSGGGVGLVERSENVSSVAAPFLAGGGHGLDITV